MLEYCLIGYNNCSAAASLNTCFSLPLFARGIMMIALVFVCLMLLTMTAAFVPKAQSVRKQSMELFEDFKINGPAKIYSDKRIFSEKQLREFTSTYSTDERWNPFGGIFNALTIKDPTKPKSESTVAPAKVERSLKSTVSLAVLEEKTAAFVKGKLPASTFYGVLKAAFGPKLATVLPEIYENLPPAKSAELKKVAK